MVTDIGEQSEKASLKTKDGIIAYISELHLPLDHFSKLQEATVLSFNKDTQRLFACERAVAYVIGRVQKLLQPWGEGIFLRGQNVPEQWKSEYFMPYTSDLIETYPLINEPKQLSIALIRGKNEDESYHLGLVLDPQKRTIWSKWGDAPVDIMTADEYQTQGYRVEYLDTRIP